MPQLNITFPNIGQKPWGADLNADLTALLGAVNALTATIETGRLSTNSLASLLLTKADTTALTNLTARVANLENSGGGGSTPSLSFSFGTAPFGTAPFGGQP